MRRKGRAGATKLGLSALMWAAEAGSAKRRSTVWQICASDDDDPDGIVGARATHHLLQVHEQVLESDEVELGLEMRILGEMPVRS